MTTLLDEFFEDPSEESFNKLSKKQLLEVAEKYNISLTTKDKNLKEGLGIVVKAALIDLGIFLSESEKSLSATGDGNVPVCVPSSMSFAQQKELLLLQMEKSRLNQEVEMRKLDLESQRYALIRDDDFDFLYELLLLEQFKNTLPENVAVFITERDIQNAEDAAILADEYVLTHRDLKKNHWCRFNDSVESAPMETRFSLPGNVKFEKKSRSSVDRSDQCAYCLNIGSDEKVPVKILRDTGASETFILESVLSFSESSSTGSEMLIKGIGLQVLPVPLHNVVLESDLVTGQVTVGVRPSLPVEGISVILGNNLAGGRVWGDVPPPPIVTDSPTLPEQAVL
ncbi:hypothetical protein PO909_017622 [Leuciscus waleckii]